MKITERELKQVIKEEIDILLKEEDLLYQASYKPKRKNCSTRPPRKQTGEDSLYHVWSRTTKKILSTRPLLQQKRKMRQQAYSGARKKKITFPSFLL